MSMDTCQGCGAQVDTDDDVDCYVGFDNRALCESCRDQEAEEPGSDAARAAGCRCRYVGLGGNDPDGHIQVNRDCPLHGIDPDAARDAQNESVSP